MINNLNVYNAWKRSTLDRLSAKYRAEMMRIYSKHLQSILPAIEKALREGRYDFSLNHFDLDLEMAKVFKRHQRNVTYVAVSDGIREVTPDKKLSTWENYHYAYPVEETFTNLKEAEERNSIFERIDKVMKKKNSTVIGRLIDYEKKRYQYNIKAAFREIAKSHYATDTDHDDYVAKNKAKEVIAEIFKKTSTQSEMIFRTETTRYFNDARVNYFQTNTDVDFVQIIAVTDGRISPICECRDGYVIPITHAHLKKYKPPFHFNCRSVQSPLNTDLKSDTEEVRRNLGSEFGKVHSDTSDKDFNGKRSLPNVKLPDGW